jgi:hypothetical protein
MSRRARLTELRPPARPLDASMLSRAGEAQHPPCGRRGGVSVMMPSVETSTSEQPGDRLVERVERLAGRNLLLGLDLKDVLDRDVRGGTYSVALPAKPRPIAALIW